MAIIGIKPVLQNNHGDHQTSFKGNNKFRKKISFLSLN